MFYEISSQIIVQISIAVLLQLIFFPFFYFNGPWISRLIKRRVCPTCFSVSSTWLSLIIISFILSIIGKDPINHLIISILLAESVVGISYLSDEFLARHSYKISEPILRFGIVFYGTLAVFISAFISFNIGFLLFLPVIFFGFWALTPVK